MGKWLAGRLNLSEFWPYNETLPFNCYIYLSQPFVYCKYISSLVLCTTIMDVLDAWARLIGLFWTPVVTLKWNTTAIIDGELSCKLLGLIVKSKLKCFLELLLNNNNNTTLCRYSALQHTEHFHDIISFNFYNKRVIECLDLSWMRNHAAHPDLIVVSCQKFSKQ